MHANASQVKFRKLMMLFRKPLLTGMVLLFLSYGVLAQFLPASPPIADPADRRFVGVKEDWSTPALTTSNLRAAEPLGAYINNDGTYTVELLQVQWRWGDPLDLYVMKPKGVSKPPVILYLYGYPTDTYRFKSEEFQQTVTKNGFAAVGFVSALTGHRYHDRPMKEWFISELQECLAVSAHDVQMVMNYLATRGDMDMDRLGMVATGSGASIAILASAVDPRIKVLDTVDPWGDWPVWMATSPFVPENERADYVKPEFLKKAEILDPVDWLPKIKATKFRMLDAAAADPITPPTAKEKLRAAAPAKSMVVVYKTPQEFSAAVRGDKGLEWIEHELQSLPEAPSATRADSGLGEKSMRGKR
jgi:hypothetical protein